MLDGMKPEHVYIACGYTDLRRGIDGLAGIVQQSFHLEPFAGSLFLFCGCRADRFKALYWDADGFVLLYKRLEKGCYQWPHTVEEVHELNQQELRWLLEGLSIYQPRAHRAVTGIRTV